MKELWRRALHNSVEEVELEESLNSRAQASIRKVVNSLPQDAPSLRWRSSLNERLLSLEPIKRKLTTAAIAFRTLAGATLVCALGVGFVLLQHRPNTGPTSKMADGKALAAALISEHRDSVESSEIAGPGVSVEDPDGANAMADSNPDSDPDAL